MKLFSYQLPEETPELLDAIAAKHGCSSRSEALRHVLAALAPIYGVSLRLAPAQPVGRPSSGQRAKARAAALDNDALRALPLELRASFVRWRQTGERPSEGELALAYAAAGPELRSRLQAAFSL
jgi:hypothetical protein